MQPLPFDPSRRPVANGRGDDAAPGHRTGPRATTRDERDHDRDERDRAPVARAMPGARLFVRHAPAARAGFFRRLVRLDIWGDTLLGSRLKDELATGYLVLAVVFLFEICAWSLLFNYVFHGAGFEVDLRTAAAVGLGGLWGLGIFAIDKGLITTDLLRPGRGAWLGFAARLGLIGVSAVLTAQPIEQLVFQSMIEERLKAETVREEAVAYVVRLEDKQRDIAGQRALRPEDGIAQVLTRDLEAAKAVVARRDEEASAAQADVSQRDDALTGERAERDRRHKAYLRTKALDDERATVRSRDRWRKQVERVDGLEDERAQAVRTAEAARLNAGSARTALAAAQGAYDRALGAQQTRGDQHLAKLEGDADVHEAFVDQLRQANYGDPLVRPDGTQLRWKRVDFIERSLVLSELRDGHPPRWPTGVSIDQRAKAIALFGLPADGGAAIAGAGGPGAAPAPEPVRSIFWTWLSVLILAAAIPALSVFYKLTMSDELKSYYSLDCQARSGNPEALALQRSRRPGPAAAVS